jgi:hypothetical protein
MTPPPKKSIITQTCQSVKKSLFCQKGGRAPNVSCPHVPLGQIQSRQLALDYCTES